MAKKRAADDISSSGSSKKCRGICGVEKPFESVTPPVAVSARSLLTLLGSRCRKRPFYFDKAEDSDFETSHLCQNAQRNMKKHAATPNTMRHQETFGNSPKPQNSTNQKPTNKRAKSDCVETADANIHKVPADAKTDEDIRFNGFHFWRTPLPALDLSLLNDSPDAMEI